MDNCFPDLINMAIVPREGMLNILGFYIVFCIIGDKEMI